MFYRALRIAAALTFAAAPALRGQAVAEIQVTPETVTLGVGKKQMVFAAAYDRQGNLLPTAKFTFVSSDTSIARVLADGTVIGVQPGLTKVEARSQKRRASLAVLVTGGTDPAKAPVGVVLTVDPSSVVVFPGETVRLTPQTSRDDGSSTPPERVTWKSLKPQIATVDSTGAVTGVASGKAIVQVQTASGLMATAPIEVAAADFAVAPDQLVLMPQQVASIQVRVPSQGNRILHGTVNWQSLDTTVARVGPDGVVQALGPGKTEVVALGYGQERRVSVTVHKVVQAFVVSPPRGRHLLIPRNGTRRFTAGAEAADSTPIPEIPVTWTVRDTAMAAFDPATGTLTAKAVGITTLTATIDSFAPVVWTIEVIPGLLQVRHDRVAISAGRTTTAEVFLVDDRGQPAGGISGLRWASDRPDIATVDGAGVVRGVTPGRALITATAPWGQSDTIIALVTGDLVVTSNRSGTFGVYALVRTWPDTLFPVFSDSAADIEAVYSPDRTQLAFVSSRAGSYDLYVADADGRHPRRVTTDPGEERTPVWMPDGRRLLYTFVPSDSASVAQVRVVDVDGRNDRALLASGESAVPAVSPDGRTVAFIATRDKRPDLYLMAADDTAAPPQRVTDNADRELLPRFFPSGDLLYAVERGRGRSARLFRRPPAGGQSTRLFDTDLPLVALSLSQDGTTMAYAVGKVIDPAKGRARFGLYLRPTTGDGPPIAIPLRPDEQIASVAF